MLSILENNIIPHFLLFLFSLTLPSPQVQSVILDIISLITGDLQHPAPTKELTPSTYVHPLALRWSSKEYKAHAGYKPLKLIQQLDPLDPAQVR